MPNWCYSNITISHYDEDRVKELHDNLVKWLNISMENNGFDNGGKNPCWLGNIVLNSGINTDGIRYRGSVIQIDLDGNEIKIQTETAWGPMMKMWQRIANNYIPSATIIYTAEEDNMGIFYTNDEAYRNLYLIDPYGCNDIESDWEASESLVIEILQEKLNTDIGDITKLLEMFEDDDLSDEMSIHKWEFVPIDELD